MFLLLQHNNTCGDQRLSRQCALGSISKLLQNVAGPEQWCPIVQQDLNDYYTRPDYNGPQPGASVYSLDFYVYNYSEELHASLRKHFMWQANVDVVSTQRISYSGKSPREEDIHCCAKLAGPYKSTSIQLDNWLGRANCVSVWDTCYVAAISTCYVMSTHVT